MDPTWNLLGAWIGILFGMLTGVALGIGFDRERFLGGYASWPRRLLRLGHVSLFGVPLLNLAYAITAPTLGPGAGVSAAGLLLLLAIPAMPISCLLAAMDRRRVWVFAFPVLAMLAAAAITTWSCARAVLGGVS